MKRDPYKNKEKYERWKEKTKQGISGVSKANSQIIKEYLHDMERGINISKFSVKGPRGFHRLNSLRNRMVFFAQTFKKSYKVSKVTDVTEEQLLSFFSDMQKGILKNKYGQAYKSKDTYAKIFKAFWHWHMKVHKKRNTEIKDITQDLDVRAEKPKWVYLTEEQVKRFCDNAKFEYEVLIMFLLDTGIRSPNELINVKVSDLYNNCKELHIRQEIVKGGSFGRRIKLMICSKLLQKYIKEKELTSQDYLFEIRPQTVNKYLKRLAIKLFGNGVTEAGKHYSDISLYDFRHISCCYWLPRYKSESALKYRFGWKNSEKIHYYSELLGMRDTIAEEDLLIDVTKTEIEQQLQNTQKENQMLKEKVAILETQMNQFNAFIDTMHARAQKTIS